MKTTKELTKDILKRDKNALRALHDIFGFDFMKEYTVLNYTDKFTINQILKELEKSNLTPRNAEIVVIIADYGYNKEYLKTVKITIRGGFDIEIKPYAHKRGSYRTYIDDFSRKGDFDEARKINVNAYVIAQNMDYTYPAYIEPQIDIYDRMEVVNTQRCGTRNGQTYEYGYITVRPKNGVSVKKNYYNPLAGTYFETNNLNDIIDKSGYLRPTRQADLIQKAKALRAERAQNAFKATDNTAVIEKLKERAKALKALLINELMLAETAKAIENVGSKIKYYDGLEGVYASLERIIEKDAEKSFSSIASFNEAVRDLNAKIDRLAS